MASSKYDVQGYWEYGDDGVGGVKVKPEFKDDMKGGHIVILVSLLQPVQILEEIEGVKE